MVSATGSRRIRSCASTFLEYVCIWILPTGASLECGDVFCFSCIADSVDDIHERFNQRLPRPHSIPPNLLQALRRPLADLPKYFEAVRYRKEHPGPEYTCPACSRLLKYRPVKVFDEEALKETFTIRGTPEEHDIAPGRGSNGPLFVDCPLL